MIFKFRIVSDGVENFKREIQIDAQSTFLDLKNAICDSVGYDKTMLDSFFICDHNWEKQKEIAYEDMGFDSDQEVWLMDDAVLEDFIDDEGQRLLFVFDYMTDRAMFMEMTELVTGKTLKDPVCTLSLGHAPKQTVDMDEFDRDMDAKAKAAAKAVEEDIDSEFLDTDSYSPEEFEAGGYNEIDY
ncbi:MAG: hypothetical protein NC405_03490 [Odoribacter sp.]|nr:hypothetical protein [Odoribacter sp.]